MFSCGGSIFEKGLGDILAKEAYGACGSDVGAGEHASVFYGYGPVIEIRFICRDDGGHWVVWGDVSVLDGHIPQRGKD